MDICKMKLDWEQSAEEVKGAVMKAAAEYAGNNGLAARDERHLCLAAEETIEIIRLLRDGRPDELNIEKDDNSVILRLVTNSVSSEGNPDTAYDKAKGVTGKLRMLYENGYKVLEQNDAAAQEIGVRRASVDDLKEMGFDTESDAFVWTLQSYDLESFDQTVEEEDEQWQEISHSILANLSEDIRLFIFPDKTELSVRLAVAEKQKVVEGKYAISSEFEALVKLPVFKTRFQVKMLQLLYGPLVKKQKPKEGLDIKTIQLSSAHSKNGKITVLEYKPYPAPEELPSVIFFHGGADLFPALPYHYKLAEKIALNLPCRVFLVMHDLAPKYNPPTQILQAMEVYRQLTEEFSYGVRPEKLAIMGDSSGGTMTAAIALHGRDGLISAPRGQLLLYPSLDMRYDTPSMKKYTDVPIVNADAIDSYRKIVRSDWSEGNKYYMSPTEAASFEGLCDAYIETTEFDALHDEGVEYAEKLKAAGVRVLLNETKGTVHSFDMADNSTIVEEAVKKRISFLKDLFRN